jgi:hypothetical protein
MGVQSGREHGVGLLEEHGRRLAWMWVSAPLIQAKPREGSGDGLRDHGDSLIVTLGFGPPARPSPYGPRRSF